MAVKDRLDPRIDLVFRQIVRSEFYEAGGGGLRIAGDLEPEPVGLMLSVAAVGCQDGRGQNAEEAQQQEEQG